MTCDDPEEWTAFFMFYVYVHGLSDGNMEDKGSFVSSVERNPVSSYDAVFYCWSLDHTQDRQGHVCDLAGEDWSASFQSQ